MRIGGREVSGRAIGLALLFAVPAVALAILLEGYWAEGWPLMIGWLVLYVWVVQRLSPGKGEGDGRG